MGGGQQPTSQITVGSSGMAYPTTTGGTDYDALGSALGKLVGGGLQQYGSSLSAEGKQNYMTNTPNLPQSGITSASPQTNVIPNQGMLGASVPQQGGSGSMEALMRLLQGMYS